MNPNNNNNNNNERSRNPIRPDFVQNQLLKRETKISRAGRLVHEQRAFYRAIVPRCNRKLNLALFKRTRFTPFLFHTFCDIDIFFLSKNNVDTKSNSVLMHIRNRRNLFFVVALLLLVLESRAQFCVVLCVVMH